MSVQKQLGARIVLFCSHMSRYYLELDDRFDEEGYVFDDALRAEIREGRLTRVLSPNGWLYVAAFPGVDIDACHRVKIAA